MESLVPLAASGDAAATAQAWQFTTGGIPCVSAHTNGQIIRITGPAMGASWPGFTPHLWAQTPYRSVIGAPLASIGVLILYFTDPPGCQAPPTEDIETVAVQISGVLLQEPDLRKTLIWPNTATEPLAVKQAPIDRTSGSLSASWPAA